MSEKIAYWASVTFGALALILLIVNISVANINRAQQNDVAARQNTISGGQALSQLNQGLVQALAETSVKNDDSQIRELLTSQGISVKNNNGTPVAAAAKTAPAADKTKKEK